MIRQGLTGNTEKTSIWCYSKYCKKKTLWMRWGNSYIEIEVKPQNSVHRCYSDLEVRFVYSIILTVKQLFMCRDMMCIFATLLEENTSSDPSAAFCSCVPVVGVSLSLLLQYGSFINPSPKCYWPLSLIP